MSFLAVISLSTVVTSVVYLQTLEKALIDRSLQQLQSINLLKREYILTVLEERMDLADQWARSGVDSTSLPTQMSLLTNGAEQCKDLHHPITDLTECHHVNNLSIAFTVEHSIYGPQLLAEESKEITGILLQRTGMGATGESYILNQEHRLITPSRFFDIDTTIFVHSTASNHALNGVDSSLITIDYRGVPVLSAFRSIRYKGLNWVILTEIDVAEAMGPLAQIESWLISISLLVIVIAVVVSWGLSKWLTTPIALLRDQLESMSKGIVPAIPPSGYGEDEIGQMVQALQKLAHYTIKTIDFSQDIGKGNFEAKYDLLSDQDAMGLSLIQMRDHLESLRQQTHFLEQRNKSSLIQGQENERKRFARDLHDGLSPYLTLIKLNLSTRKDVPGTTELIDILDQAIDEIRKISYALTPAVLLDFGIGKAIRNLVELTKKSTNIRIVFNEDMHAGTAELPEKINVALYRVVQESINNAVRHSEATELKISLTVFPESVSLFIHDNGIGFDVSSTMEARATGGLNNLKQRIELLTGEFNIYSTPENGTTTEVEIPLSHVS